MKQTFLITCGALVGGKPGSRDEREAQEKLKAVERKIARLDEEKLAVNQILLTVTESAEATRLQSQLADLTAQLAELEEEWLQRSAELE